MTLNWRLFTRSYTLRSLVKQYPENTLGRRRNEVIDGNMNVTPSLWQILVAVGLDDHVLTYGFAVTSNTVHPQLVSVEETRRHRQARRNYGLRGCSCTQLFDRGVRVYISIYTVYYQFVSKSCFFIHIHRA